MMRAGGADSVARTRLAVYRRCTSVYARQDSLQADMTDSVYVWSGAEVVSCNVRVILSESSP